MISPTTASERRDLFTPMESAGFVSRFVWSLLVVCILVCVVRVEGRPRWDALGRGNGCHCAGYGV